jgi:ribose/xylose/arabinose/galactoside ABC-type transport system permease subunit
VFAIVAGTAFVALFATRAGLAEGLAHWFSDADPFVANLALTMLVGPGLVLALLSQRRQRKAKEAQKELSRLSRHDPLTGLPNRTALPGLDEGPHRLQGRLDR